MLDLMGVRAFLDQEELELGDSIPEVLQEAIRSASVHIAIFSPRYAESPWCLEELSLMLQTNAKIIPVFYCVNPSDLRHENGIYANALRRLRLKRSGSEPRYRPEKIREWEEALRRVSYLSGEVINDEKCDVGKVSRNIVNAALPDIKKVPLQVAIFPVGLDEAVQDFESKVGSSTTSENVRVVGIVGMGGSGKTTLARELFNIKSSSIFKSSFVSNVRDADSKNTLHQLQKHLLKDLGVPEFRDFHHKEEGITILNRALTSMTMLIVLDDVDKVDQMHFLLPPRDKLGQGSFIIVTTREEDVLKSCGISSIYSMKLLEDSNAELLFCRHAFSQPYSHYGFEHQNQNSTNFEDHIKRFVKACNGLPLSLKVFGAMVNGKSKAYWESQLQKIFKILPKDISKSLRLSYDALDDEEQQMFLDAACFFIGANKSLVVTIWDGTGWSGELGLETLKNKCLIGFDKKGNIEMHDHLRDLGREIARDASPSRLWDKEQMNIEGGGTLIRGIMVEFSWVTYKRDFYLPFMSDFLLPLEHFMERMRLSLSALQLLAVRGADFRKKFIASSRNLVSLHLYDFEGTNLPSWLSLENLRVLQLCDAKNLQELWKDNVQPPLQLRELIIEMSISEGTSIRRLARSKVFLTRSIGLLRHLKKVVLHGSNHVGMRSLPEEFCDLESLEILELSGLPKLSSLPADFGKLRNLRRLKLDNLQLRTLPSSFKKLRALQSLDISDCNNFTLTSEMLNVLEFMTQLHVLNFLKCPRLEESPHLTTQVSSLRELSFCLNGLRELPNNIGQLTRLETLRIWSLKKILPGFLGGLSCLTSLMIGNCEMSESLSEAFGRLSNLRDLDLVGTKVLELGLGMGTASASNLKSLKSLSLGRTSVCTISISDECCPILESLLLSGNEDLTEIETLPGNVRYIEVLWCKNLKSMRGIGGLQNLQRLTVSGCPELEVLPCPTYMHSNQCEIEDKDK